MERQKITVQQVFDTAIHLMDEQSEQTGDTQTYDTNEYRYRTINILNALMQSLYLFTDVPDAGLDMPMLSVTEYNKPDFTQFVPLSETLALGVLPYGLAGQLIAGEDDNKANLFFSQYREALMRLKDGGPQEWEPISTPYGLF